MSFFKSKKSYILIAVAIIVILQIVGKTLNYYRKSTATPDPYAILADPDFNRRLNAAYDIALTCGDYKTTFTTREQFEKELLPVAETGNTKAETVVGEFYRFGYLTEQNTAQALFWLKKAGNKDDLAATMNLGNMYYSGKLIEKDMQLAIHWYKNNAENGNSDAQGIIGTIYFNGLGNVKKDYKEAFKWLKLSADQGNAIAQALLGGMYLHGWGVPENHQKARELFTQSAAQNYAGGYLFLGLMYQAGWSFTKDLNKARENYQKAADLGSKDAIQALKDLDSATLSTKP